MILREDMLFLYPTFSDRSTDTAHVNVYQKNGFDGRALNEVLGL